MRLPRPDEYGNYYLGGTHKDIPCIFKGGRGKAYREDGSLAYNLPQEDRWFVVTADGPVVEMDNHSKLRYFDDPKLALEYLNSLPAPRTS